jgi:hypothetical protein
MVLASRVFAAMAWDLFANPNLIAESRMEFQNRLVGRTYTPLILPNQPPPLDYRLPSRKNVILD